MKKAKSKKAAPRSASTIDKYIGAQMRQRRLALSMSQEKLGTRLGVSFQQIQNTKAVKVASVRCVYSISAKH